MTGSLAAEDAVERIHAGTAVYTREAEVNSLLDLLRWPDEMGRMLDPGAGDGAFLVAAISRLDHPKNDVCGLSDIVRGYEFHPGAVQDARRNVAGHLESKGWNGSAARAAARAIVQHRDFLLSDDPSDDRWDVLVANPPYWRMANLPDPYRTEFLSAVPRHAQGDMLYAYLQKCAAISGPKTRIGLITSDRWLLNAGSSELRSRIGNQFTVHHIRRLDPCSAFHRPKSRRKGTPARVHPVCFVLMQNDAGRPIGSTPFHIDPVPSHDGVPLGAIATITLAPWLGPAGIFLVRDPSAFPTDHLIPCYEPNDLADRATPAPPASRWALLTNRDAPHPSVLHHISRTIHAMPPRGRRTPQWIPPETFRDRLPHDRESILVPRISKALTPLILPARSMSTNHNLVIVSEHDHRQIARMLLDERVQRLAHALAPRLEDGYRSFNATLLRRLVIPFDLLPPSESDGGSSQRRPHDPQHDAWGRTGDRQQCPTSSRPEPLRRCS